MGGVGGKRGSRQQATSAHRCRDHIEARLILQELESGRALSVDHVPIIERVDQRQVTLGHDLMHPLFAIRERDALLHYLSAQGSSRLDLGRIGVLGYEDERRKSYGAGGQ